VVIDRPDVWLKSTLVVAIDRPDVWLNSTLVVAIDRPDVWFKSTIVVVWPPLEWEEHGTVHPDIRLIPFIPRKLSDLIPQ